MQDAVAKFPGGAPLALRDIAAAAEERKRRNGYTDGVPLALMYDVGEGVRLTLIRKLEHMDPESFGFLRGWARGKALDDDDLLKRVMEHANALRRQRSRTELMHGK